MSLTEREKEIAWECWSERSGMTIIEMFNLFLSRIRKGQEAIGWYFNDGVNRSIALSTNEKDRAIPVFTIPPASPDCSELVEALEKIKSHDVSHDAQFKMKHIALVTLANHAKRMKGGE